MRHRIDARGLILACLVFIAADARAQWPANGAVLCAAAASQDTPAAAADGLGGAVVAWQDLRSGNYDVYVQRTSAFGSAQWAADGVALCTAVFDQTSPSIAADGAGGAIVAWRDARSGSGFDIYANRVHANGAVAWAADGVPVCTVVNNQYAPVIIPDGAGGAIVAWYDFRSLNYDVYAQRVDGDGAILWAPGGVAVCTKAGTQNSPVIVCDGAGGAVVAWPDFRNGNADVFAQRLNGAGSVLWAADGVGVCTDPFSQTEAALTTDGYGGAIAAWRDPRAGNADVYAQRLDSLGVAQWTANGVVVCNAVNNQTEPAITGDDAGGAVVVWRDARGASHDIYAQRLDAAGAAQWAANGVAVCGASQDQMEPVIVSDGAGGASVAWRDQRDGNADIYAQRMDAGGAAVWTANGIAMCTAANDQVSPVGVPEGTGGIVAAWQDARGASNDIYAYRVAGNGGIPTGTGPFPGTPAFAMGAGHPNPFSSSARIDVELPRPASLTVELFDVTGRRLRTDHLGHRAAGAHRITVPARDGGGAALPSGVYFCRVRAGRETQTRKLVIAR